MKQGQGRAAWIYRKVLHHSLLSPFLRQSGTNSGPVHVGWGYRPSGQAARKAAARTGDLLLLIEDAFVRSLHPGGGVVYGLLADSCGIHYDASGNSDLLKALNSGEPTGWMRKSLWENENPDALMQQFRESGASKYNWFPGEFREASLPDKPGILVVDQTRGDMSLRHGGLAETNFAQMLQAALDECEGAPVYLRAHPDHLFRSKRTCFPQRLLSDKRIRLLSPDLSPTQCFSFCHTVMVGSSLMGMEALIHGAKVITYGAPFYAGWGLTEDRGLPSAAKRERRLDLTSLFEFAYLRYCHYFDPDTQEPCGLGAILDHLELQKQMFRKNRGLTISVGFSPWKRQIIPRYFRSPAGEVVHVADMPQLEKISGHEEARILVWGRKAEIPDNLVARACRVEDGFLRSKGLGASFNFPYSWVVDHSGIYFDSTQTSDLEKLLNEGFSSQDLARAGTLIEILREKRLSKYNLKGAAVQLDRSLVKGRKVILIPGQVEADASIAFGSPHLKSNLALLHEVRRAEPDAYLIFKAHPDLVAGTRHGSVLPHGFAEVCDLVVTDGNVLDWLDICDEVHTMTSTVGFEALIRQVPVTTYGMPFYAGWGLTKDRISSVSRTRRLTLEELVCGALIHYPRYINPLTGEFTTAEKVAFILSSESASGDRRDWYLKLVSKLKKIWVELAR
jgi:capsular polysaccharide export protein